MANQLTLNEAIQIWNGNRDMALDTIEAEIKKVLPEGTDTSDLRNWIEDGYFVSETVEAEDLADDYLNFLAVGDDATAED